jgi:Cu2+-exporting ATPase
MKSSVIEVDGMLSVLNAHGVEKQLAKLRGVERAEVNYVSGSATVVYDETVIDLNAIKSRVHKCGYHCSGELVPKHLCKAVDPPSGG